MFVQKEMEQQSKADIKGRVLRAKKNAQVGIASVTFIDSSALCRLVLVARQTPSFSDATAGTIPIIVYVADVCLEEQREAGDQQRP